jgi:NitT/TauT family transport system permease protein
LLAPALVLLLLLAWEAAVHAGWSARMFFPAPSRILVALVAGCADGQLLKDTGATLTRLLAGFFLGAVPGALLGMAMGRVRLLRVVADPIVSALHPIPKIAILPLFLIIFGLGETSRVVLIAVAAFFPMLISTMAGVRQISPIHFEVAHNCGAGARGVLAHVILPGSLPLMLAGARLALNTALTATIAVELMVSRNGLGAMTWSAWQTLRIERLYVGLVAVAVLGIGINALLKWLMVRFVPWQTAPEI